MDAPDIYSFTSYRNFLKTYYEDHRRVDPKFSIRYLSRKLRLKSPATLNMILRGHRNPSARLTARIMEHLRLTTDQRNYFSALVEMEKSKSDEPRLHEVKKRVQALNPNRTAYLIDDEVFRVISNWYFLAIREMVSLPFFQEDPAWISKAMDGKITSKQAQEALEILESRGLIARKKGRLVRTDAQVATSKDVPSEAIKRYHEQNLDLAKAAIREVAIELRDISASVFNLHTDDLPRLKAELREIRNRFYQTYERSDGNATYQINFQLVPVTKVNQKGNK